ncbi:MAG: prolipoprotein diacylglyceryl transferase [Lachnospiraceae bacterium]|nr:prolipoprotein diacylglyceryl transferase [Lachnospiraceae bacterium]
MYNDLFSIGPVTVHGYGLMVALGIIAAYLVAEYRARKRNMDPDHIFNILIFGVIFGFTGSKLLYAITVLPELLRDPSGFFQHLADGWVVYGAIIGGVGAAAVYCKVKKISILSYLDLCVPSLALGQAIGRIGCLLAGCCYGATTDSSMCIVFTHSNYAPNHVALIPTQIYSSLLNFLNFFVLLLIGAKAKKKGIVISCYLMFYSVGRFVIEFYRGDLNRGFVGNLSTSQFIAIFIFLLGVVLFLFFTKKNYPVDRVIAAAEKSGEAPGEQEVQRTDASDVQDAQSK